MELPSKTGRKKRNGCVVKEKGSSGGGKAALLARGVPDSAAWKSSGSDRD